MTSSVASDHVVLSVDFHGARLVVTTDHPRVATAVASRFAPQLVSADVVDDDAPVAAQFVIENGEPSADIPVGSRAVYESDLGEVRYRDADQTMAIRCGRVSVDADLGAGVVVIRYATGADDELALAAHPLLTLPLLEILKRRGLFSLHAACVADGAGAGLLLAGTSGSGKSTTSVALAVAGRQFLSDDMVFLTPRPEAAPSVRAFPDELDLTDGTVERFAALHHLHGRPTWGNRPKHQIRPEVGLGVELAWSCEPHLLLFPVVAHTARTAIEPLGASEALVELAPNVLLTEPAASQAHLDALGALVRRVPTHRVLLGEDLDDAVRAIERLAREGRVA